MSVVLTEIDDRGVATVTLNRPAVHNAYDGAVIDGLLDGLARLAGDPRVRVLLLRGQGRHFQAGADLAWLQQVAAMPPAANRDFSVRTTRAMRDLHLFPVRPSRWSTVPASAAGSGWRHPATSSSPARRPASP